jgi:hypothetical protein
MQRTFCGEMNRLPTIQQGHAAGSTNVDNETLASLALNLQTISATLVQTQKETAEIKAESAKAQKAASEAIANNVALQAQLDCQSEKRAGGYKFRHLGNELVYFSHVDIMSKITRGLAALRVGNIESAEALFISSNKELMQQNKYVKMADSAPAGWSLILEILGNDMVNTPEEERQFKRAEQACDTRYKRKLDAEHRARGSDKKPQHSAASSSSGTIISSSATSPQYVQFPLSALTGGSTSIAGQVVQGTATNTPATGSNNSQNTGATTGYNYKRREIGPCFNCQGPHLARNCPEYAKKSEEVQARIEADFAEKKA